MDPNQAVNKVTSGPNLMSVSGPRPEIMALNPALREVKPVLTILNMVDSTCNEGPMALKNKVC